MVQGGLVLAALAVLGFFWPRLLAWPLAAFSLWMGLALFFGATRRREPFPLPRSQSAPSAPPP